MTEHPAQTVAMIVAVIAGFYAAVQQPATDQFNDITRALDWSGPILAPLSMLYATGITLLVMTFAYGVAHLLWQRLVGTG